MMFFESVAEAKADFERRGSERYPIEREVRYRIIGKKAADESGAGTTVNISSGGVLFTTDKLLLPGKRIEMAISWPAQLNDKCPLKLVAQGRIVRYEQGLAAISIQKYEFRTMGAAGLTI
ncbi:MAG: PilZ domain-containing protein [Bryobacteraceae bacterium]|nr:PilZ domain-containing protein [Bryobacteraceae bacterium]